MLQARPLLLSLLLPELLRSDTLAGLYIEGWGRIDHVLLFAVTLAVAAVPEGLPAGLKMMLALGVERMAKRKAVMRRVSAATSVLKAFVGGLLLVLLPRHGLGLNATRSTVFLYESIAQLIFAYPSRRVTVVPRGNRWLHLAVILGVGLQLLAIGLPSLRQLLGLTPLDSDAMTWMAGGVLLSWMAAEIFSRAAWSNGRTLNAKSSQ